MTAVHFLVLIASLQPLLAQKIDVKELRCLVCRRVVEEVEKEIEKVDPKKMVEVGTYRLDHKGDQKQRMVEYRKSEVYLTEMMENICNRMDDYVRARMKSNGQLVVVPLITEKGAMNPIISQLDIIQDSDLNKSLKFYCEGILEEYEEGFVKLLSRDEDNLDIKLCSGVAKLCDQSLDQEDYKFEEEEEQHYSADHMEL